MFDRDYGILFHGERATMFVDRRETRIVPEKGSTLTSWQMPSTTGGNFEHWTNFLDCVRTRQRPVSDIEKCQRSTTTCLLGNIALRTKQRVDLDTRTWTVAQPDARKFVSREYRAPWKLAV